MELDVQIGRLDVASDGRHAHIKHLCEVCGVCPVGRGKTSQVLLLRCLRQLSEVIPRCGLVKTHGHDFTIPFLPLFFGHMVCRHGTAAAFAAVLFM